MTDRPEMIMELKRTVLPYLRSTGFRGSFPHLRRLTQDKVDLLTFQFDRWGGGVVVELARCSTGGVVTHWGEHIPAERMRAWDVHPNHRIRLQRHPGSGTDSWFRFDAEPIAKVAKDILAKLSNDSVWDGVEIGNSGPAKG
jgi:hypothetical protein